MQAEIYWIEKVLCGRMAIMPRPRGSDWLEDELKFLKQVGVDVIVSLLTDEEVQDLELDQEKALCEGDGMEFMSFPIPDRRVPDSIHELIQLLNRLHGYLHEGKSIAIHCRAGVGRSASIAAALLCTLGFKPDKAFEMIAKARGLPVPDTTEQRRFVSALFE